MFYLLKSVAYLSCLLALILHAPIAHTQSNQAGVTILQLDDAILMRLEDSSGKGRPDIFPSIAGDATKTDMVTGQNSVCNVFLLKKGDSLTMFDSGWGSQGKGQSRKLMQSLGIQPEQISNILITHMHIDHISGLVHEGRPVFPKAAIHISKPEFAYWLTSGADKNSDSVALARAVAKSYEGRISTFNWSAQVLPGIMAEPAPGHTPGHTIFTIGEGLGAVTIIGDLVHAADLQLAFPDISAIYDVDPAIAATTRHSLLEQLAKEGRRIAGMHIRNMGRLKKTEQGGFVLKP